jgi:hypothetical protein
MFGSVYLQYINGTNVIYYWRKVKFGEDLNRFQVIGISPADVRTTSLFTLSSPFKTKNHSVIGSARRSDQSNICIDKTKRFVASNLFPTLLSV